MKTLFFIIFLFFCFCSTTHSQTKSDTIYIGTIIGQPREQFIKEKFALAKTIGISDIINSKNRIEVRLYETYLLSGLVYCTTIYLDTTLKMSRIKYWTYFDSAKYQSKESQPMSTINSKVVFSTLIANGLFSLPNKNFKEIYRETQPKELTRKGLSETNITLVTDGIAYVIEYKIDNIFNRLRFSNPKSYLEAYPDNQIFRRQYEITKAMGAGFE